MSALHDADLAWQQLKKEPIRMSDAAIRARRLPMAVRRMGLVRCLEWLVAGTNARRSELGSALHRCLAPALLLHTDLPTAVKHLEECPRRELFQYHRRAVALFDALAIIASIEEGP